MIKGCRKDDSTVKGFRKQACGAYMPCATYLQVKLPLDNAFLRAASSIDPTAHGHHLCTRMLKRLKDLVPCNLSDDERQGFDLEVHQLMVDQNLPAFSEPEGDRVDEWWAKVHATQRYKAVSKVALAVCCVLESNPHSTRWVISSIASQLTQKWRRMQLYREYSTISKQEMLQQSSCLGSLAQQKTLKTYIYNAIELMYHHFNLDNLYSSV